MESKTDNNSEEKSSEVTMVVEEEPLGSLTLPDVPELKGQQLRSSARVFKKMKLDTAAPLVVPEKCEEKKEIVKENKKKCLKPLWTSDDKTVFFEALNEYGKDFESIQLYMSNKFRKKGLPDQFIKTKEQIRHLYYRTWAKISKYLKFADGIKKPTQELYALINYGELRKKIGSVNEKYLVKLNKLIYKGSIVLSIKGKKIRIKTPFCRALRKLNQLDDNYEEIKLPNRLAVELRPKDMASFLRVQSTAQNPRLKTYMPLQKRLSGLIDCLSKKWQNIEAGMYDKALMSNNPVAATCMPSDKEIQMNRERLNPLLRLTPPPGSKIELPSISLGEYFTRQSICFNSHETRLGLSGYNSYCNYSIYKMLSNRSKKGARPRADSVSDKSEKSPHKTAEENCDTAEAEPAGEASNKDSAGGSVGVNKESGGNVKEAVTTGKGAAKHQGENAAKKQEDVKVNGAAQNVMLEAEKQERISAIRRGWTARESECITLGEAYLMFGHNSTLVLEYSWDPQDISSPETEIADVVKIEPKLEPNIPSPALDLSEPLSKLLSVAKLHYRKNIIKCPCGHVCGNKTNAQLKKDVETKIRKILTDIDKCADENEEKVTTVFHNGDNGGTFVTPPVYMPPKIPISPYFQANAMQLAAQIASIQRMTPRYCNRKGRRPRSKQVVVERQLPLLPNNIESGHQIVRMNIISKEDPTPPHTVSEAPTHSKPVTINSNIFIPSTSTDSIIKPFEVLDETLNAGIGDFGPSSPSRIFKEGEQWINSEVGDYSLSSLLGHLESPVKSETNLLNDDSRMSQDVDAQLRSMMTQNSVDFSASFADLAAQVALDTKRNDSG